MVEQVLSKMGDTNSGGGGGGGSGGKGSGGGVGTSAYPPRTTYNPTANAGNTGVAQAAIMATSVGGAVEAGSASQDDNQDDDGMLLESPGT